MASQRRPIKAAAKPRPIALGRTLALSGKIGEALAALSGHARLVQCRKPVAVVLAGAGLGLPTLVLHALDERRPHVVALLGAVRASQLPVDKNRRS